MARSGSDLAGLALRLGHCFKDLGFLRLALTHVSATPSESRESNQRLEFLGDRVLGLAVAELLHERYPQAGEGELSHRLSALVRREACAVMAARWDIGPALVLGPGVSRSGGRRNDAILADAAEAVLGAVFLDGGYEAARAVVAGALGHHLTTETAPVRDAKTALQEWAQGRGLAPPTYAIAGRSGPDHAPRFDVAARLDGMADALGQGRSRRMAEQAAAQAMLVREGVWSEPVAPEPAHA